ncbi:MAG: hypothetical protein F9K30_23790, partial [Dechloromonas sp.]
MKNPAVLVSRHPRLHERASAAWALELVLQLHGQASATRYPFQRRRPWRDHDFASDLLAELHARGIKTEIACYGPDFARFETDLRRKQKDGPAEFPVVRVPSVALADWMTAGLHVLPGIFLVGEESGEPEAAEEPQSEFTEVIEVGSRTLDRSRTETPVPVDV